MLSVDTLLSASKSSGMLSTLVKNEILQSCRSIHDGLKALVLKNLPDGFWSLLNAGRIDRIIEIYQEKKRKGDTFSTDEYYAIARALVLRNEHGEAIDIYEEIMDRYCSKESDVPSYRKMSPYKNIAFALLHRGNYAESIDFCDHVLNISNEKEVEEQWRKEGTTKMDVIRKALWIKGHCLNHLSKHDEAIETFMELDDPAKFKNLVCTYEALKQDEKIFAEYERFKEVDIEIHEYNSSNYFHGLCIVYYAINRSSESNYAQYRNQIVEKILGMDKVPGIIANIERLNFVTSIIDDKRVVKKMIHDGWNNYKEDIRTLCMLRSNIIAKDSWDDDDESKILQQIIDFVRVFLTADEIEELIQPLLSDSDDCIDSFASSLSSSSTSTAHFNNTPSDFSMNPSSNHTVEEDKLAMDWSKWFHDRVEDIYDHLSQRCEYISTITSVVGSPTVIIELDGDDPRFSQEQVDEMRRESLQTLFGTLFDSSPAPDHRIIFEVDYDTEDWGNFLSDSSESEKCVDLSMIKVDSPLGSFKGFDGFQSVYVFVLPADPDGSIHIPVTERGLRTVVWNPPEKSSMHRVGDSQFQNEDHTEKWYEFIESSFDKLADCVADRFANVFAVTHRLGEPCIEIRLYGMEYMHPKSGPDAIVTIVQEETSRAGVECAIDIRNERPFENYRKRAIRDVPFLDEVFLPVWGITQGIDGRYYQEELYFPHVGSPIGIAVKGKEIPCVSTLGCFLTEDGDVCPSFAKTVDAKYALSSFHGIDVTGRDIHTLVVDENANKNIRTCFGIGNVIKQNFTPKTNEDFYQMTQPERDDQLRVITVDATLFDFSYATDHNWVSSNSLDQVPGLPRQLYYVDDGDYIPMKPFSVFKLGCISGFTRGEMESSGKEYELVTFYGKKRCCTRVFVVTSTNNSQSSSVIDGNAETSNPAPAVFARKGDSGAPVFDELGRLYGFVLGGNIQKGLTYISMACETLSWARQAIQDRTHPPSPESIPSTSFSHSAKE